MTLRGLLLRMHGDFRRRIDSMEAILKENAPAEAVRLSHELTHLILLLQAHEWIEETILHPTLVGRNSEAVLALNSDGHRALSEKLDLLQEALAHPQATLTLFVAAEEFFRMLRAHMAEEEAGVLTLAARALTRLEDEQLGARALEGLRGSNLPAELVPLE